MHKAIAVYAKQNNLKSYEAYSKVAAEFLQWVENSETPPIYQECPKDVLKKSIGIFEETLQGLKALKQRDQVTEYLLIYHAALRFIEKHRLLPNAA